MISRSCRCRHLNVSIWKCNFDRKFGGKVRLIFQISLRITCDQIDSTDCWKCLTDLDNSKKKPWVNICKWVRTKRLTTTDQISDIIVWSTKDRTCQSLLLQKGQEGITVIWLISKFVDGRHRTYTSTKSKLSANHELFGLDVENKKCSIAPTKSRRRSWRLIS